VEPSAEILLARRLVIHSSQSFYLCTGTFLNKKLCFENRFYCAYPSCGIVYRYDAELFYLPDGIARFGDKSEN
jgi:hypothetical protein